MGADQENKNPGVALAISRSATIGGSARPGDAIVQVDRSPGFEPFPSPF